MTTLERFKFIFKEEFDDPNESFLNFLLSLIPKKELEKAIEQGIKLYYDNLENF